MKEEVFIKKYTKYLKTGRAVAFLGAGMSAGAGFVNWKELLKDVATELELDITKEDDLVSLAQFYVTQKQSKKGLIETIIENINTSKTPTKSHSILARLPLDTYWTTNYDDLIEKSLFDIKKRVDVKRRDKDLLYPIKGSDVVVYKMHGDVSASSDAVITKDDYELFQDTHGSMLNALKGDLTTKSFLFLGYSFSDPDLNDLLARIRCMVGEEKQEHFAIMREVKREDVDSDSSLDYAKKKRLLQINDFRRYGIEIIEISDYNHIERILEKIAIQVNKENVFISSAVADSMKDKINIEMIRQLVKSILEVSEESKIISGYGLNVGSVIIDETMEHLKINELRRFEDKLKLYPFPVDFKEHHLRYRETMLANVGVCILMYGTRDTEQGIKNSVGIKEEFEIAKRNGSLIIPVGATGGMSSEIADILIEQDYFIDDIKYLKETQDPELLVNRVIEMIKSNIQNVEEDK